MVLGILVVELQHVVVDVGDGRDRHPVEAELLELEAGHRPGRVLEQDLVDAELDLLVRAADQVLGDDLLRERLRRRHGKSLSLGGRPLRCARRRAVRGLRSRHPPGPAARRPTPSSGPLVVTGIGVLVSASAGDRVGRGRRCAPRRALAVPADRRPGAGRDADPLHRRHPRHRAVAGLDPDRDRAADVRRDRARAPRRAVPAAARARNGARGRRRSGARPRADTTGALPGVRRRPGPHLRRALRSPRQRRPLGRPRHAPAAARRLDRRAARLLHRRPRLGADPAPVVASQPPAVGAARLRVRGGAPRARLLEPAWRPSTAAACRSWLR